MTLSSTRNSQERRVRRLKHRFYWGGGYKRRRIRARHTTVSPDKRFICTLFARNAIVLISLRADSRVNQQTHYGRARKYGRRVYMCEYCTNVQRRRRRRSRCRSRRKLEFIYSRKTRERGRNKQKKKKNRRTSPRLTLRFRYLRTGICVHLCCHGRHERIVSSLNRLIRFAKYVARPDAHARYPAFSAAFHVAYREIKSLAVAQMSFRKSFDVRGKTSRFHYTGPILWVFLHKIKEGLGRR